VTVAILVPIHRPRLDEDERTSLRHLCAHLGAHDVTAVSPVGLEVPVDVPVRRFDARHFRNLHAYSDLLLSRFFYDAFREFEYVLVHQLDCLVLSDELDAWSGRGYDYVGAPWVRRDAKGMPFFTGVGNGGFSLRRVEACLRVLELSESPGQRIRLAAAQATAAARRSAARLPRVRDAVRAGYAARFRYEDKFWSEQAPRLLPGFRIPPPDVAVAFAFETEPRFCFEQNGRRLPFGCHRWAIHDRAFWEPHLLTGDA
jgi:hypothetical protein